MISPDTREAQAFAEAADLVYVDDGAPGLTRRRAGKGFAYYTPDGVLIRDPATLDRIHRLAIPPAYRRVWVCPDPNGHIQATGRDARGRKQYRYHDRWRQVRDETKFARMAAFGRALPALRDRVEADLRKHGLPKDKVLATVARLLETTLIRVGNDAYAKANRSFGLTTFRNRHLKIHGGTLVFEFRGKSGVLHRTDMHDRRLSRLLRSIQDLPGQRLFQYLDADGRRRPIGSHDVNAYLREAMGEAFTAKDFRTWAGTLAAAKALALAPPPASESAAKRAMSQCVKATAALLGNTPAVCRAAYIHPAVLDAFARHRLPKALKHADGDALEQAVLTFLDGLTKEVQQQSGLSPGEQLAASTA
jgi:DNA topoisomerase-1